MAGVRFCQRCKRWVNTLDPGGFPAHLCQIPEDGHTFRFTVTSRGSYSHLDEHGVESAKSDADWFGEEPWTLEVRAWNLHDALRLAAEQPLNAWDMGERE